MCSVEETDFDNEPAIIEMTPSTNDIDSSPINDELCKCAADKKIAIKIGLKDGQCIDCFFKSVRHKFRATLGSTKCIPRGSAVALIHNGRPETFVLLDVVHNAISEETFKRIHLQPHILYIDEDSSSLTDDLLVKFAKIKRQLLNYDFPIFYTSIWWSDTVISFNDMFTEIQMEDVSSLETAYHSISDPTSRYEFLQITRKNCIRRAAKQLKCNYAFVSDIGPDLATTFLTNIVLGRGNSVAQDVSLIDYRSTVQIIRPIRDLNYREVEMYIKFSGIDDIDIPREFHRIPPAGSVQALTMNFVNGLQSNFSSTVSTVFKTGDKMHAKFENLNVKTKKCCQFCLSDLDGNSGSTTLAAIDYSRYMSLNGNCIDIDSPNLVKVNDLPSASNNSNKVLCHSCRNIIRDVTNQNCINELINCDDD